MPQSLTLNFVHLIFSTKYRTPMIDDSLEAELFAYLGGLCNELQCPTRRVGGYRDHVHIVCMLSKHLALMKLLQQLKANSSRWVKTRGDSYRDFRWQDGYAAFSVNPSEVDKVVRYIDNQKNHHFNESYQVELRRFLTDNDMDYDERYIWD
jgi:REP element-mobilizing transposase RayT